MQPPAGESPEVVTRLLADWKNGSKEALDMLTPLVYNELRRLANHYLRDERAAQTLQPTAIVHEAYLRLVAQHLPDWESEPFPLLRCGITTHATDSCRSRQTAR
jgi:ECF sigma factor